MPDDRGTIRQVAWTELFPWLELLRVFRLATQARFLLLAAVAVMLTFAGWWVAGQMFGGSGQRITAPPVASPLGPWSRADSRRDETRATGPSGTGEMLGRPI